MPNLNKALYTILRYLGVQKRVVVLRGDDKINAAPSFSHFSLGRNDIHGQFTLMVHFILKGRAITGQPYIILINIYPGRYAARTTRAEDYLSQYTNAHFARAFFLRHAWQDAIDGLHFP